MQAEFERGTVDQKKLAVASRLADHRLAQLREDMQQTQETITLTQQQLEVARAHLSRQDRDAIVQVIWDLTRQVYQVCRTMRSRFEAATQAETLLRHMIHEQAHTGIRDIHNVVHSLIQRMAQATLAHFGVVQVDLDRLQDAYNEAGRRVDTLNRGRLEQEEHSTGDNIGLFRVIEEYAEQLTQRHAAQSALQRLDMIKTTAEAAVAFIQVVQHKIQYDGTPG
jgi:hypothetical protein